MSETNQKKTPSLPKEVAEKYDCVVIPCVVNISKPAEIAGRYDLTKITMANAEKLAKAGKFLKAKVSSKEPAKESEEAKKR